MEHFINKLLIVVIAIAIFVWVGVLFSQFPDAMRLIQIEGQRAFIPGWRVIYELIRWFAA